MATAPPPGWQRISPCVFYEDPDAAIDWLAGAFGFEVRVNVKGPDGKTAHSELTLFGEGPLMVAGATAERNTRSPRQNGGVQTQQLFCHVPDVDAHCKKARGAGAKVVTEPETQHYGDRHYSAEDCEGHLWIFGQRVDQDAWDRAEHDPEA